MERKNKLGVLRSKLRAPSDPLAGNLAPFCCSVRLDLAGGANVRGSLPIRVPGMWLFHRKIRQ